MSFFVTPDKNESCFESEAYPKSFIDILYDHKVYLGKHYGFLGPQTLASEKHVAIIGAGAAGLSAARLLMKMGLHPVIYEASDRIGGRVWSDYPIEGDTALFEMGAMRVPRSEQLFQYYADEFKMQHARFPDPGIVDTTLYYENKTYSWPAGSTPPAIFKKVSDDWNFFVTNKLGTVSSALRSGDYATAKQLWQTMLTQADTNWANVSFFQGLQKEFPDWTATEFSLFGALGLGSGGFGPLYTENFAELARLIINGLETCQQFYPGGLSKLIDGLYNATTLCATTGCCTTTPQDDTELFFGSLREQADLRLNTTVRSVVPQSDGSAIITSIDNNGENHKQFDAVIIATTTRAMEIDMAITNPPATEISTISESSKNGIRKIHLMNSSKIFVLTKTKFWLSNNADNTSNNIPSNIQTDELCRGVYCLDYPGTDYGVVLLSYTWGDDSTKLLAISDAEQRFKILADSLKNISAEFATRLINEKVSVKNIDWELEPHYYGAFKLNQPGQDIWNQAMYYQFLSVLNESTDTGVYLAGDSISWSGGWIEGALQTGMNAASAVIEHLAGELHPDNPLTQNATQYDYGA